MSQHRLSALTLFAFLLTLSPNLAMAKRVNDQCSLLRADHARHLLELKRQQADELQQCEAASGRNSCMDLKERQKEEMRQMLERQRMALAGCNNSFLAFESENQHYYHNHYYQNTYYSPGYPKRHHHDHDGDGDHHHHDHDGDGGHHHHSPGAPGGGGHVATVVASHPNHDSGSHSATVSTIAVHNQWVHSQNAGSGWSGGGSSSSASSSYSGGNSGGGSSGSSGGGHSGGGYSGGGGGGGGYSGGGSSASSGGGGSSGGGTGGSHGVSK